MFNVEYFVILILLKERFLWDFTRAFSRKVFYHVESRLRDITRIPILAFATHSLEVHHCVPRMNTSVKAIGRACDTWEALSFGVQCCNE